MKLACTLLLIFPSLFFFSQQKSTWQASQGPCGGEISCLLKATNNKIFAGTGTGVFFSEDDGKTWRHTGISTRINCMAEMGGNLYFGTHGQGILKADLNGENWLPVNEGLSTFYRFCGYCIRGLYQHDGLLVAATGDGLYTRTPGDSAWQFRANGFFDVVAMAEGKILSSHRARYSPGAFIELTDLKTFQVKGLSLPGDSSDYERDLATSVACDAQGMYAIKQNTLFLSPDKGLTWNQLYSDTGVNTPVNVMAKENEIYLSTRAELLLLKNGQFVATGLKEQTKDILKSGPLLFAGSDLSTGIFCQEANEWKSSSTGLKALELARMSSYGNLVVASLKGGVAVSTDTGFTWQLCRLIENRQGTSITHDEALFTHLDVNENYIIAATNSYQNPVFVSSDEGKTWISMKQQVSSAVSGVAVSGKRLYVQCTFEGYSSIDGGISWQKTDGNSSDFWWNSTCSRGDIYRVDYSIQASTDGGVSWQYVTKPGPASSRGGQIWANDSLLFYSNSATGLYLGPKDGSDWFHAYTNNVDYNFAFFDIGSSKRDLFLHDRYNHKLLRSDDWGRTWKGTSLDAESLQKIGSGDHYVYAAIKGKGIWRFGVPPLPAGDAVAAPEEPLIYPNPSGGRFTVHVQGETKTTLYDLNGRVLLDETTEKEINATTLHPGVYVLKIITPQKEFTRKIIIK